MDRVAEGDRRIASNRATVDEKAKAWDRLMRSTGDDATALQDAWEYCCTLVYAREDAAHADDHAEYPHA